MNKIINLRETRAVVATTPPPPEEPTTPMTEEDLPNYSIGGTFTLVIIPHRQLILVSLAIFLGLVGLLFLFWQNDWIGAIFFWLAGGLVVAFGQYPAIDSKWEINQHGIAINDRLTEFSDLQSFWVEYPLAGWRELSIRAKKWYHPYIKIPITAGDPLAIRRYLLHWLPEEKHESSLVDILTRWLGF